MDGWPTALAGVGVTGLGPGRRMADARPWPTVRATASPPGPIPPDDVTEAVQARMRRNSVVREGDHRFAIVLEESVLRYRIGDADTMAAQLGHLLSAMALPSVSLGVIPFAVERTVWPMATFTAFDGQRVHADSLDAAETLTAPGQVDVYLRAFQGLSGMAVYGAAARGLVTQALAALDE
ncbi:DUF5753 domain-containing protein [Streptomyces sp. NPDC047082]|uniref:DUF5753 domain-containing protein n=2 Tax=Streptomyces TaxID=1883 RepID=UPI0033C108A7